MERGGCIYIMANPGNTTIYIGVTSSLPDRVLEHKEKFYPDSFTARYNLTKLVYFEIFDSIEEAIDREKYIKGKRRIWKNDLIGSVNPLWKDLWEEVKEW